MSQQELSIGEKLCRDIETLGCSIEWLEDKLEKLCCDGGDKSQVPRLMKEKDEAECLLEKKRKELENYKNRNRGADTEDKNRQEEFDRKNNSYSIIRNSYFKSNNN